MKPVWAAPATPTTYGLWAWYDMSSAAYVTVVGGGITVATDRTGNGRHATQPGAAIQRPTWPGVGINGVSSCDMLAGSSQCLIVPSMAALTSGERMIVVAANEDPPLADGTSSLATMGTINGMRYPYTTGLLYDDFGSTANTNWGNMGPNLTAPHNYDIYSAPSDKAVFLDGVQMASTTTNTVGFPALPYIGFGVGVGYFSGRVGEVLLYSRKLSDNERDHNNRYLKAKWGL